MSSNSVSNTISRGGLPIGKRVYRALDSEYNQLIFAALCVGLILMIIVLYKYTYSQVTKRTIEDVDKLRTINTRLAELRLKQLDTCQQQNSQHRHRLCDYYIASSYNTACTGQQHFGYVSDEMIAKALKNGARFIHLKIAADSTNRDIARPVVCTAIGQRITSMNTVPLREALLTIRQHAFTYERTLTADNTDLAPTNYPLFIYLDLHTPYESVLDQIATDIHEVIGQRTGTLVDADRYRRQPLAFAPLCDLLNQIVIFASPGYENSAALDELVVPLDSTHFAQVTDYERIMTDNDITSDSATAPAIESKLSAADRHQAISRLADIIAAGGNHALSTTGINDITAGDHVLRHMIGLSIVFPVRRPEDEQITTTTNPDPIDIMRQGAQFVCMHYQSTDDNMRQYLELFLHKYNSSFILKPSGMRLPPSTAELDSAITGYRTDSIGAQLANRPVGFPGAEPISTSDIRGRLIGKHWRVSSGNSMQLGARAGQLVANLDTRNPGRTLSNVVSSNLGLPSTDIQSAPNLSSSVFQIQEHPLSTQDTCLVMLVTLDGRQVVSVGTGDQPTLQNLDSVTPQMAFYLEQVTNINGENSTNGVTDNELVLFRAYDRRVPTYLGLDRAIQRPTLMAMSTASNDNLGFGGSPTGVVIASIGMELTEALVRRKVQMWIQHPQLGTRFIAVFGGDQLGLTGVASKQAQFELRRVTEDGMVAIILPASNMDTDRGAQAAKLLVNESASGQAKLVPYGQHNVGEQRKWRFLILRQSSGRVYLDDENGNRLGALDDGRLRWRATWPLDTAATELYMNETAVEVVV